MPTEFQTSDRVCSERVKILEVSPHALFSMLQMGYSVTKNRIAFTTRLAGAHYDHKREMFVLRLQDNDFPVVGYGAELERMEAPTVKILESEVQSDGQCADGQGDKRDESV